jgi:hypothetical protein
MRNASLRAPLGLLCLVLALVFIGMVGAIAISRGQPAVLSDNHDGAQVTFSSDRKWVLFPGDCVQVAWTLENVAGATFFPRVEPGIIGGEGVRSVFFGGDYFNRRAIYENAPGGVALPVGTDGTVQDSAVACVDYTTQPKLRVQFADTSSVSYSLGLDILFLRVEIWLAIIVAAALVFVGAWLLKIPSRHFTVRLSLWLSAVFLVFYSVVFLRHPNFLQIYILDAPIFFGLLAVVLGLTALSLFRPGVFDDWISRLKPGSGTRVAVVLFWIWTLAFGYASRDNQALISELMWMPFFLWAFVIGMAILWWATPQDVSRRVADITPRRMRLLLALLFAALSFGRDLFLLHQYSVGAYVDSPTYLIAGERFLSRSPDEGLQKRIFPYVFMNFAAQSTHNPIPLVLVQAVLGAIAIGLLVYVLSRRGYWFASIVGILLTLNLSWGAYNRAILTESGFISFHVLSFAVLLWHLQRGSAVKNWELFAAGALYGWTFLFRGTGLPLIVPVVAIYYVVMRGWWKPLAVVAGFSVFLLAVGFYNQWRHGEFGLVGPQEATLASALFSYHLFSPDNGDNSREMDRALRECMGYLDYHDIPRHSSSFINHHFKSCLEPLWGRDGLTAKTGSALRELVLRRPFEFTRVLLEEVGLGLAAPSNSEFYVLTYERESRATGECRRGTRRWCETYLIRGRYPPDEKLVGLNNALTYPNQLYLSVEQFSSATPAVALFAFVMFCGFLWMTTGEKLLVVLCAAFVFYQLFTITVVHVFFTRYGLILGPFFAILSALALIRFFPALRRIRFQSLGRWTAVMALVLIYIAWSNGTMRRSFVGPLFAQLDLNALEKYGVSDTDFAVYQVLLERSGVAVYPEQYRDHPHPLAQFGVVTHAFDHDSFLASRLMGWQATRLPGYLRAMGASHLLLDDRQWAALTDAERDILNDPAHYMRVGEWGDGDDTQRLYEIIGDARGDYAVYDPAGEIAIFEQPDEALDVYRLDENRNGALVVRISRQEVIAGKMDYPGFDGWSVSLDKTDDNGYIVVVRNAEGELVDRGFGFYIPRQQG